MFDPEKAEMAILSHCSERWQKVAMVIANTSDHEGGHLKSSLIWGPLGTDDPDLECDLYIAAIKSLVRRRKLSLRGDASWPRYSEVRVAGADRRRKSATR